MKKVLLALVASVIAVTFAVPAFAEDAKPAKPAKHEYTGDIKAIDAAKHSLTVTKKEGDEKTFSVAEKAKIHVKDNEAAELSALKVGDKVTVTYTENDGKNVANKIGPPDAPKHHPKQAEAAK